MSLTCDSLHGHIPSRPWNVESRSKAQRLHYSSCSVKSMSRYVESMSSESSGSATDVLDAGTVGRGPGARPLALQADGFSILQSSKFFREIFKKNSKSKEVEKIKKNKKMCNYSKYFNLQAVKV